MMKTNGLKRLLICVLIVAAFCVVTVLAGSNSDKENEGDKTESKKQVEEKVSGIDEIKQVKALAQKEKYPEEITQLLDKNEETIDFVKNYMDKKDSAPAETIGEKPEKGQIPSLIQWDERWGYSVYGTSTIAASGCGPTCMAMVICGLTGDNTVTPYKMAKYSEENSYVDENNNTYWLFMNEAASAWGITSWETLLDEESLALELKKGNPVICSVGPGNFTKSGHFIVLTGYEDGKVTVNDPFSKENSSKAWVYSQIAAQIKEMWVYSIG